MRAKKISSDKFRCSNCWVFFEYDDLEQLGAILTRGSLTVCDDDTDWYYLLDEDYLDNYIWKCPDGCDLKDAPERLEELWQCGSCEHLFEDKEEAGDCCL